MPTITIFAYPPSDSEEFIRVTVTNPDGTTDIVNWNGYTQITFIVRETSAANALGNLVAEVNSVDNASLFRIEDEGETLIITTSKIAGIEQFGTYECLLKVHDNTRPDGQVIADYKTDSSKPTLMLKVFPGNGPT